MRQMQQASAQSIIISEILDSRTRSLVSVSEISDYVLSNELVSMALAMVAEDREINRVLEELFAEEVRQQGTTIIQNKFSFANLGHTYTSFRVMRCIYGLQSCMCMRERNLASLTSW